MPRKKQQFEETVALTLPPPATTLEGREEQLISAAMDLVERRIHDGTASAQETVHFLKLASTKNQVEQQKLESEVAMLQARIKEAESRQNSDDVYARALQAFRGYSGLDPVDPDAEEEIYDPDLY